MSPKILLRIAAGCLLFFILGHTIGHFTWKKTEDPLKIEIIQKMDQHKFDLGGSMKSIGENYEGYSLFLLASLSTLVVLLWIISSMPQTESVTATRLLIPILLCILGFAVLSYLYFFMVPAATSLAASIFILIAILKLK